MGPQVQHVLYKKLLKIAAHVIVTLADGATTGTDNTRHI